MKSTIKIKNTDYAIKQTIRSIFLFEQITGKQFELNSTLDNYIYFYCILLANNPDFMTWDEFINNLDEDPTILINLNAVLNQQQDIEQILNPDDETDSQDKKKE